MKRVIGLVVIFLILITNINIVSAEENSTLDTVKNGFNTLVNKVKDSVGISSKRFKDVDDGDWFKANVFKLAELGIINGNPDGTFMPNDKVTRAQFVKMVAEALKLQKIDGNSYNDISAHWAKQYIEAAERAGIITRNDGYSFRPDEPLKRSDMAAMLCRGLGLKSLGIESPFSDVSDGWANRAFDEYLIRGYVEGGKRNFKPEGATTRAEASTIIVRMLEYRDNAEAYKASVKAQEEELAKKQAEQQAQQPTPKPGANTQAQQGGVNYDTDEIKGSNYRVTKDNEVYYITWDKREVRVVMPHPKVTEKDFAKLIRELSKEIVGTEKYMEISVFQEDLQGDIGISVYEKKRYKNTPVGIGFVINSNMNNPGYEEYGLLFNLQFTKITKLEENPNNLPKSDIEEYLKMGDIMLKTILKGDYIAEYSSRVRDLATIKSKEKHYERYIKSQKLGNYYFTELGGVNEYNSYFTIKEKKGVSKG